MILVNNSSLERIVESGFVPTDDADLRLKKVTLTLVPLIIGPAAFIWGTLYFLSGHTLSGSIPMSYAIISAISLGYFFKTKKTWFIQRSQLVLVLILPFLLMWSLGGFAAGSMVMIWAIFAPIAALMFLEKKTALMWFLAYFVLILISALIDGYLAETVTPLPALARDIFYVLNMGCGSAGLYLLVSYSIGEEKQAIKRLKDERLRLEAGTEKLNQEIKERKQAQAALGKAKEQAEETGRMLHTVLDTIPVRIFWKDRNLNYLGCNRLFAQDAGKSSPQEVVGATDYDMRWRDVAEQHRTDDVVVMEANQPKLNFEEQQTHQDCAGTWLRTSKVPLLDASGEVMGVLGTYEDITENKAAEQALVAARDAADRANQAKSEFLSSMSHELRTPMNAILGFGQLLEIDDTLSREQQDNVQEILKAGHHLLELINEVLDLAKVESGRIVLSLEPLDVATVAEECLSMVSTLAATRDIRIRQSGLQGTAVRADRTRLRQALLNLLSNAVKYNRVGGNVDLEVRPQGLDRLCIRVTDTGPGIPAERLEELFQPFNRLGAENSYIEGAGIGLTITRRIVEMMGGSVHVESDIGVGSTFTIDLPLASVHELAHYQACEGTATDSERPASPSGSAQQTVLYIEDNPSNLKLVTQILVRRPNIHLLTAHTPDLGIELALAHQPDLILLDINLPGMDGYQALEIFKADDRTRAIPVIAVTANALPRDIERGKAAGFSDYLIKPLNIMQFHAAIDQLLYRTENQA
jgi:PAS domain S-box-containing protein